MSLKGRLALVLVVIFLAGAATGLFGGAWHARRTFAQARQAHVGHRMREHLRRQLQLTPEQEEQVSPIFDKVETQLETIRADTSRRVMDVMVKSREEIAPYLTAEQRVRLDEIAKRHRRNMRMEQSEPPPDHP